MQQSRDTTAKYYYYVYYGLDHCSQSQYQPDLGRSIINVEKELVALTAADYSIPYDKIDIPKLVISTVAG
jgi:hypothetical protein